MSGGSTGPLDILAMEGVVARVMDGQTKAMIKALAEVKLEIKAMGESQDEMRAEIRKLQEWKERELERRANMIANALSACIKNPAVVGRVALLLAFAWLASSGFAGWIGHAWSGFFAGTGGAQ